MRYNIFFSYQSDTKGDKIFILNALNDAKSILSKEGIDIDIDHGMRRCAGTANLLDTMLGKGRSCDIFIADLTYVTSFSNYSGATKYLPNPNVMFELGAAWTFHSRNKIILVQNESCGGAEKLPVDLRGERYPIRFNLTLHATKAERKKIGEQLAKDFYDAISNSVKRTEENNKTEYLPFEKYFHWNSNALMKFRFIPTPYFSEITGKIKLQINTGDVIISGKAGSGKSRIVKETLPLIFTEQELSDIYICDLSLTTIDRAIEKYREIKPSLRRPSVFVFDRCSTNDIRRLSEIIYSRPDKHLFITNDISNDSIKIDRERYVTEIINIHKNNTEIRKKYGSNLQDIIPVLFGPEDKSYYYRYSLNDKEEIVAQYLSLFSKVGYDDQFKPQFRLFCSAFGLNINDTLHIVDVLLQKEVLIRKGGFIFFDADKKAEEYAKDAWSKNFLRAFDVCKISNSETLTESFFNRQIAICSDSATCKSFLLNYIKTDLRKTENIDTRLGSHVLYKLSEKFQDEVLQSLEITCSKNPAYVFKETSGIYWLLEKSIREDEFFIRATMLALKISVHNIKEFRQLSAKSFRIEGLQNYIILINRLLKQGELNSALDICEKILKTINSKDINKRNADHLTEIIQILSDIRGAHQYHAESIVLDNIAVSCRIGISKIIFRAVKNLTLLDDTRKIKALKDAKAYLAGNEYKTHRQSIDRIISKISRANISNLVYEKVILAKSGLKEGQSEIKAYIKVVAHEIVSDYMDPFLQNLKVLLEGGRKYDSNAMFFGMALSTEYNKTDKLVEQCLTEYRNIPAEEQSYGFIIGLLQGKISNSDYTQIREYRDRLLLDNSLVYCGLSISNSLPTTMQDITKIMEAIDKFHLPYKLMEEIYSYDLRQEETFEVVHQLIKKSQEATSAGIYLLFVLNHREQKTNLTQILTEILSAYNYWNPDDYSYDSTYSRFIDLLEQTIKSFPNDDFAMRIIKSMIISCGDRNFNVNYSLHDLVNHLLENYQTTVLSEIEPVILSKNFDDYPRQRSIEEIMSFTNNADIETYLKWCDGHDKEIAEFVIKVIPLIAPDESGNLNWTEGALHLMNKYSKDGYLLSNISTRLYNGLVSISRYTFNNNVYSLLFKHENDTIRLWAVEQSEHMKDVIYRELRRNETYEILER